jgi:hypothetical protein
MSNDHSYFAERAIEERRLAIAATDANVRRDHLEMAAQYASQAAGTDIPTEEGPEQVDDGSF